MSGPEVVAFFLCFLLGKALFFLSLLDIISRMTIKTKKHKFSPSTYVYFGLSALLAEQAKWGVPLLLLLFSALSYGARTGWMLATSLALLLYIGFWALQFYGVTLLEENRLLFERLSYQLSSREIYIQMTSTQGMPLDWGQIKKARQGKDYFLLTISRAQLIYLPYKVFNSRHEIKFLETVLKRKKLL